MLHRSGLHDFYEWCLPFLTGHACLNLKDKQVSAAAFDVLEEACQDEQSLNQLLQQKESNIIADLQQQGDLFVAKFLRSELGFILLHKNGWVQQMLDYWIKEGNYEYTKKIEQSMYNGLNLNQINGTDADFAMQIWIPIYDHSNDLRSEVALLKRFPFSIMLKMESKNLQEPILERMQTYFDINNNNELQIVGKLVKGHSKAGKISLEELGNGYISVCTKLGCTYVDSKCRPNEVPSWTLSQIDNQLLERLQRNRRQRSFLVMKDGINFCFQRHEGLSGARDNILAEFFLEQVVLRVKILPVKYKTIKNPIHFYGELVKTKNGAEFLRNSKHL